MIAPELLGYEKLAIRDLVDALPGSNLPWREPSYSKPTFWSRPLVETIIRPIDGNSAWENMIEVRGNPATTALVNSFVATTFGDATLSDVDMRLIINGRLVSGTSYLANVDYNKISPSTYPVIPRPTFAIVRYLDTLAIQMRNRNASPRLAICAFFGWRFDDNNPADKNFREGITDVG